MCPNVCPTWSSGYSNITALDTQHSKPTSSLPISVQNISMRRALKSSTGVEIQSFKSVVGVVDQCVEVQTILSVIFCLLTTTTLWPLCSRRLPTTSCMSLEKVGMNTNSYGFLQMDQPIQSKCTRDLDREVMGCTKRLCTQQRAKGALDSENACRANGSVYLVNAFPNNFHRGLFIDLQQK